MCEQKIQPANIQTQINNISTNYLLIPSLPSYNYATKNYVGAVVSAHTTTIDLNANYVRNSFLATQLNNYCLQSNYTALKTQADATTLLLTGGSWDATYNF